MSGHENQSHVCVNVRNPPHMTLCISILDDWRRSIITSGSRFPGDCQHKDSMTANQMFTHSTMPEFVNLYQVIVMYEYHVTVGHLLYISC